MAVKVALELRGLLLAYGQLEREAHTAPHKPGALHVGDVGLGEDEEHRVVHHVSAGLADAPVIREERFAALIDQAQHLAAALRATLLPPERLCLEERAVKPLRVGPGRLPLLRGHRGGNEQNAPRLVLVYSDLVPFNRAEGRLPEVVHVD